MKMVGHAEIVCSPDKNTAATFQLIELAAFLALLQLNMAHSIWLMRNLLTLQGLIIIRRKIPKNIFFCFLIVYLMVNASTNFFFEIGQMISEICSPKICEIMSFYSFSMGMVSNNNNTLNLKFQICAPF